MDDRAYFSEHLIAWLEGELDSASAARMQRCVDTDRECRAEFDAARSLYTSLDALGTQYRDHTPGAGVDLVDAVLRDIASLERAAKRESIRKFQPVAPRRRFSPVYALAAAVLAVLGAGAIWYLTQTVEAPAPGTPHVASLPRESRDGAPDTTPAPKEDKGRITATEPTKLQLALRELAGRTAAESPVATTLEATSAPELASLTPETILALRRDAAINPESRARLASLARLPEDTARTLAAKDDLSVEAMAGLSDSLPPEDATALLMTAIGKYDGTAGENADPKERAALQYRLGEVTGAWDGTVDDPDNAMPLMHQALGLLQQGDVEGALAVLDEAAGKGEATGYATAAAEERAATLEAAGVERTAARLIAALTAGNEEYQTALDLGTQLIEFGNAYAEQGDVETARRLYEAALQFGDQLESSSTARERLAGLDVQREAIASLEPTYTAMGDTASLEQLTSEAQELTVGVDEVAQLFDALNQLFSTEMGEDLLGRIADVILEYGDVNLFDLLG